MPGAFQLLDVLSDAECAQFVTISDALGYHHDAPVSLPHHVRHNTNVNWVVDESVDAPIWERCRPLIPERVAGAPALGLNARFRFYRYREGDFFRPHTDGAWPGSRVRDGRLVHDAYGDRISQMSMLLFLSDGYTGGRTLFYVSGRRSGSRGRGERGGRRHPEGCRTVLSPRLPSPALPARGRAGVFRDQVHHPDRCALCASGIVPYPGTLTQHDEGFPDSWIPAHQGNDVEGGLEHANTADFPSATAGAGPLTMAGLRGNDGQHARTLLLVIPLISGNPRAWFRSRRFGSHAPAPASAATPLKTSAIAPPLSPSDRLEQDNARENYRHHPEGGRGDRGRLGMRPGAPGKECEVPARVQQTKQEEEGKPAPFRSAAVRDAPRTERAGPRDR